jgi:hypothetical protein
MTLGPAQPPIQWVLVSISPEVKRPACKADHSPPSNSEVKKCGAIPPLNFTRPKYLRTGTKANFVDAVMKLLKYSVQKFS